MTRGAPDGYQWQSPQAFRQSEGSNLYVFHISTPANTASGAAQTTDVTLEKGFLSQFRLRIPAGHAGLTGLMVHNFTDQVIPKTAATFILGNDEIFHYDFDIDIPDEGGTRKLRIHTYNEDDYYPHIHYLQLYVVGYPA